MNPYDSCVQNVEVDRKQITLIFHIDNILLACTKANVVTKNTKKLDKMYGSLDLFAVTRGEYYKYLGMTFDFKSVSKSYVIT